MPQLVYLEWLDACTQVGWHQGAVEPAKVTTVGFLVHESDVALAVSTSHADHGDFTDPLCIPKGCITKRQNIDSIGS